MNFGKKPRYGKKSKLCFMDTDSFIVRVKTDDIYKDIAEDVETRFETSNFEVDRPLPKGKIKKVIGIMKDKLDRKIMKEFIGLKAKTYSYLKDNNDEDKKPKGTKKCVIKRKLKFQDHKKCLEAAQIARKIKYLRKKKMDLDSLKEDYNLLFFTEGLRRSSPTLGLGKGILDSPYLLIPLISTKNKKLKPWTHTRPRLFFLLQTTV